eukprot:15139619-Ditylum_brightwellii.AAC.1
MMTYSSLLSYECSYNPYPDATLNDIDTPLPFLSCGMLSEKPPNTACEVTNNSPNTDTDATDNSPDITDINMMEHKTDIMVSIDTEAKSVPHQYSKA